jgi:hypothetical protein
VPEAAADVPEDATQMFDVVVGGVVQAHPASLHRCEKCPRTTSTPASTIRCAKSTDSAGRSYPS